MNNNINKPTSALHTAANLLPTSIAPLRRGAAIYRVRDGYHPQQARRDWSGDDVEPAAEESSVPEPAGPGLQASVQDKLPRELQQQPVLPIPVSNTHAVQYTVPNVTCLMMPGDVLLVRGACIVLFCFRDFPCLSCNFSLFSCVICSSPFATTSQIHVAVSMDRGGLLR